MAACGTAARAARASSSVATKKVLQPASASARATGAAPQPYASALTTPAHSAGTALFSSLRQFATMASRSTVSTPVAVASAAAWFASGESTVLAGTDFGSETMFMPQLSAGRRRGSTVQAASVGLRRQMAVLRQIAEPRELAFELQFAGAGGAMALLADDDFGLAVHQRHFELPFFIFGGADARLLVGEVIFLAKHEHHDVGVLLDRAGFTQVRQLRALVVAALDLTRQLRQRDDGNVQFLGERFQAGGDLRDFLHAIVVAALSRTLQQLNIVDHDEVEALLPLQPARARGELRNRKTAGLVDIERQRLQFDRVVADFLEVGLGDAAAADRARGDTGLLGQNTGGELFGGHFAGEEADNAAVDGLHRAVGLDFGAMRPGDVVGDVGGQRGLAHAGTAGDDDQIGGLQAAHLGVEIAQARCDAGQFAVALKRLGRHIDGDGEGLRKPLEAAVVAAGLGQFVQSALGILDLRARSKIHRRVEGDIDHVLADPDQIAAQRQFIDRASIILGIDDGGGFRGEAGKVLADRHAADVGFGRDEGLQRDRGRDLAHPDQAAGGLEDGLMDRLQAECRLPT